MYFLHFYKAKKKLTSMEEFFSKLSKRQRNLVENFKTQSGRGASLFYCTGIVRPSAFLSMRSVCKFFQSASNVSNSGITWSAECVVRSSYDAEKSVAFRRDM